MQAYALRRVCVPFHLHPERWEKFAAEEVRGKGRTARSTIKEAGRICGLFPLDVEVACMRDGAMSTGIWNHNTAA